MIAWPFILDDYCSISEDQTQAVFTMCSRSSRNHDFKERARAKIALPEVLPWQPTEVEEPYRL